MQIKLTPSVNAVDQRDYAVNVLAEASVTNDVRLAVNPVPESPPRPAA